MQCKLGKALGRLLFTFDRKGKHTAHINLKLCFPELTPTERKILLKKNYAAVGISVIETAIAWFGENDQLPPCEIIGLEHWQALHAQGRGVLLISAHLSCLEIAGRLISSQMKVDAVYRPQKLNILDAFARFYRSKFYPKIIERHDLRTLIRSLKAGEAVWYTPDVDAGLKNSVFVPFFGISAATITTSSRLAKLGNAACLTAFFYREDAGYKIIFSAPLDNFPSGDDIADATKINHLIETAIRKKPEQYLWQYKRFKTRPPGETRYYSGKFR
jgi:KDO2-lipid IV(A) lauroyltransferase